MSACLNVEFHKLYTLHSQERPSTLILGSRGWGYSKRQSVILNECMYDRSLNCTNYILLCGSEPFISIFTHHSGGSQWYAFTLYYKH